MRTIQKYAYRMLVVLVFTGLCNVRLLDETGVLPGGKLAAAVFGLAILTVVFEVFPAPANRSLATARLRQCADGCELLKLFLMVTFLDVMLTAAVLLYHRADGAFSRDFLWTDIVISTILLSVTFWNGIIRVYLTSGQLGIRWRVLGALFGPVPVLHLIFLGIIIRTTEKEVRFENDKILLNDKRREERVCATKYPILLLHGVFFRDFRYINYWGRIPGELEKNGAVLYYGNQQSAASVEACGREVAARILAIVAETGCEKVNIIGHSKGGLDARSAASVPGVAEHIASITTINTPHRGCEFADYLLSKIPKNKQDMIAGAYNAALRRVGDYNPDFMSAVTDLTSEACRKRNEVLFDVPGILFESVGSKLNRAGNGRFPLNLSWMLVKYFDGANDGLVGEYSFPWGSGYRFLTVKGKRGISHGDMVDLNRENIPGFDVREFYVQLVAGLKNRGL